MIFSNFIIFYFKTTSFSFNQSQVSQFSLSQSFPFSYEPFIPQPSTSKLIKDIKELTNTKQFKQQPKQNIKGKSLDKELDFTSYYCQINCQIRISELSEQRQVFQGMFSKLMKWSLNSKLYSSWYPSDGCLANSFAHSLTGSYEAHCSCLAYYIQGSSYTYSSSHPSNSLLFSRFHAYLNILPSSLVISSLSFQSSTMHRNLALLLLTDRFFQLHSSKILKILIITWFSLMPLLSFLQKCLWIVLSLLTTMITSMKKQGPSSLRYLMYSWSILALFKYEVLKRCMASSLMSSINNMRQFSCFKYVILSLELSFLARIFHCPRWASNSRTLMTERDYSMRSLRFEIENQLRGLQEGWMWVVMISYVYVCDVICLIILQFIFIEEF